MDNFYDHCALTLRHRVRRLEERREQAVELAGEQTYRTWQLYMAACARVFAAGRIGVVEALFNKPGEDRLYTLPLTRADLYRERSTERSGAR